MRMTQFRLIGDSWDNLPEILRLFNKVLQEEKTKGKFDESKEMVCVRT